MSLRAILSASSLSVDPGSKVTTELEVANTGDIVEDFHLEVVGPAAAWASVEPADLALFPGDSDSAVVTFAPPRHPSTRAADLPFGVKVTPTNEPSAAVVEEGHLEVKSFVEVTAEVMPEATRGKFRGKLGVAVDSRSNVPTAVSVKGQDATGRLGVNAKPLTTTILPGGVAFFKLKVKPHHKIIRGTMQNHRYKVVVEPEGGDPVRRDATHMQRSILPRGSFPIAGLAIIALVVLLVLRPSPTSTAVTSSPSLVAASSTTASTAAAKPSSATTAAHAATPSSSTTSASSTTSTTPAKSSSSSTSSSTTSASSTTTSTASSTTTTTAPPVKLPAPYGQTLEATAAPGSSASQSYAVPSGEQLGISQVLFENVEPDSGVIRLEMQAPTPANSSSAPAPVPLLFSGLSGLGFQTLSFAAQPVDVPSGWSLVVDVSCAQSSTESCDAGTLVSGQLTASPSPQARR